MEEKESQFEAALKHAGVKIIRFRPDKQKCLLTDSGAMTIKSFMKHLQEAEGLEAFPKVLKATIKESDMTRMVSEYAEANGLLTTNDTIHVPEEVADLTLNVDVTTKSRDDRFFMTLPNETISKWSGDAYIGMCGLKLPDAYSLARKVAPEYLPRSKPGVFQSAGPGGEVLQVYNKYIPPKWKEYRKNWDRLPDTLPPLFEKLVNHVFPLEIEREYFFAWLHASMFSRAFVYLVLCGAPGTGKNRLKLVLRALHGHANAVDGKRSTLVERFNSQLSDSTLAWFDELHYDADMENTMKELQNDSISIERKGVDATRATRIHASLVISNNKPRDNYIAFDARKFVPLQVSGKRLEESMAPEDIQRLTEKVENEDSPTFDIAFIARIAKWIEDNGQSEKWPNLEYRGPMFWTLAHTSMARWQKKAAKAIFELQPKAIGRIVFDEKKGFLWSSIQESVQRKNGDKSLQFPDPTTVRYFFDVFRDGDGKKAFKTMPIPGDIMGDFYVKTLADSLDIVTEASALAKRGDDDKAKKEKTSKEESEGDYL